MEAYGQAHMKYLDVVVENKGRHTDSFFTYRAPDETELRIGDKVWIYAGEVLQEARQPRKERGSR